MKNAISTGKFYHGKKGWIGNSFIICILSSVEYTGSKHCPTCMVNMLMSSIPFMRIITLVSCAVFVSGLFKITEPKSCIVLNSVANPFPFLVSMVLSESYLLNLAFKI